MDKIEYRAVIKFFVKKGLTYLYFISYYFSWYIKYADILVPSHFELLLILYGLLCTDFIDFVDGTAEYLHICNVTSL